MAMNAAHASTADFFPGLDFSRFATSTLGEFTSPTKVADNADMQVSPLDNAKTGELDKANKRSSNSQRHLNDEIYYHKELRKAF